MQNDSKKITFRTAKFDDLSRIVELLANDDLGAKRESAEPSLPKSYEEAFAAINEDQNNILVVAIIQNIIAGVLQLTLIPSLTYKGGWRSQIEGVRVAKEFRSRGIGREMFEWAIDYSRQKNCVMVQLTTDKQRPNAIKFYQDLGFKATHEGFKFHLL
ncbi:GNAT family N-acetyltransferase [Candidatus Uabimicrobium sp. HlEnr_7]|uniref:GNAT family N-acetyltransferase n=1 Tax=Candidatus Uabimicrobium helgolandensis TaxID=3095367 RepID=UPI0035589411